MKKWWSFIFVAVAILVVPTVSAETKWGVRAGYYTDVSEPFVGVEALVPISGKIFFNPNVEYVLIDGGDLFTINADAHYDFDTGGDAMVWAGAGLALAYYNLDDSDTEFGGNIFGGVGTEWNGLIPYAQLKYTRIDEGDDFVIGVGLRF